MRRWLQALFPWVLIAGVLTFFAIKSGDGDPPQCTSPPETPCITFDGSVLVPTRSGGRETISLEQWRQEKPDAQSENDPGPFIPPGP